MATALQQQLQQLAVATGLPTGKRPKGRPSLLYDAQQAADIDLETIYGIGCQGFEQLCRLDARFQAYGKTLFGAVNQSLEREQQTAEVNARLDASVAGFCRLLSAYFLLPPAFKALEYLIRRFRVHEHNVPALVAAALPYHGTNEFVRLVQVLRLARTPFEFLEPMQESGAALPREALVLRLTTDKVLLRFVCDLARDQADPRHSGRAAMPFYAATLCEVVAGVKAVDDALLTTLLPYLGAGLGGDVIPDYRAATYMLLTQLATRATMSADLITVLVTDLCKSVPPSTLPQALMVLAHLASTQPHFSALPPRAFKHLAKVPGLASELAALAQRGARLAALTPLVVAAAVAHAASHPNYGRLLEELVARVPLGPAAADLAAGLLEEAATPGGAEAGPAHEARLQLAHALDLRYPEAMDAAVNAALERHGSGGKARKGAAAAPDAAAEAAGAARARLFGFLEEAFAGSARSPLLEAGTTLCLAVDAVSAGVRQMALERLDALAEGARGSDPEAAAFLQSALLRRLQDEEQSVVQAALGTRSLLSIPPVALLDALSTCLRRALRLAQARAGSKAGRAAARGTAKKAVKVLAGPFVEAHPQHAQRVAPLLMAALLAGPSTRRLADAALQGAKRLDHPLLAGLRDVHAVSALKAPHEAPAAPPPARKTPKKAAAAAATKAAAARAAGEAARDAAALAAGSKAGAAAAQNLAIISALAAHVAGSPKARAELQRMLCSDEGHGRLLQLLVANASMALPGGEDVAAAMLSSPQQRPYARPQARAASAEELSTQFGAEDNLPSQAALASLVEGAVSEEEVEGLVLVTALRTVPSQALQSLGASGLTRLFMQLCKQPDSGMRGLQLHQLVARVAETQGAAAFLSDVFGLPAEAGLSPEVQATALGLWTDLLMQGRASGGKGKAAKGEAAGDDGPLRTLPRLLAALAHPSPSVRAAALACVAATHERCDAWWSAGCEALLPQEACAALLAALRQQEGLLLTDGQAAEQLLESALAGEAAAAQPPPTAAKGGRKQKQPAAATAAAVAASPLALGSAHSAAMGAFLLQQLPLQTGAAGMHAAHFTLHCLQASAEPALLLAAGQQLLGRLRERAAERDKAYSWDDGAATPQEQQLGVDIVGLYTPAAVGALLAADRGAAAEALGTYAALLESWGTPALSLARAAALGALRADLYAALPAEVQARVLRALLRGTSKDASELCRAAARDALAAIPLAAETLLSLLDITAGGSNAPGPTPAKKRGPARAATNGAAGRIDADKLESCIAALELLQWKEDVQQWGLPLVPALQAALAATLDPAASGVGSPGAETEGSLADGRLMAVSYVMQLALAALLAIVRRVPAAQQQPAAKKGGKQAQQQPLHGFDFALAVKAAQAAPDGAVRNAALSLVGALASAAPHAALSHVLDVVAVVGESSATQNDAHSSQVAAQALAAVVPAWVAGGNALEQLVAKVVEAAPRVPAHRRLPVLSALVSALPAVEGLSVVLALLLEHMAAARKQQESTETGEEEEGTWAGTVASGLLHQTSELDEAECLALLLQLSMDRSGKQPTAPLPMLATAFATKQLRGKAARGLASGPELQSAWERVMQQAVSQLQVIGQQAAAPRQQHAPAALAKAATQGIYGLLQGLQQVMAPAAYVAALAGLVGSPIDRVRRKAMALLMAWAKDDAVLQQQRQQPGGAAATAGSSEAKLELEAAQLAVCGPAVALLQPAAAAAAAGREAASPLTQQVALSLLGVLAQACGPRHPQPFMEALPSVLATLKDNPRAAVRGSALAAVAAVVRGVGPRLVPLLLKTVEAVVGAAEAAAAVVSQAAGAPAAKAGDAGEESEEEEEERDAGWAGPEAQALELAAALAALAALVDTLGAFLAPHFPAVLGVVLQPTVLQCQAAHCAEVAAAVRRRLAETVPPRLLLPPLLSHLDSAVQAGEAAACSLLSMVEAAVQRMDSTAVAAHYEATFAFLLRALDLRRRRPDSLLQHSDGIERVEAAAVAAFVGLTLKLSESRFKPLFFRLVEWVTTTPADASRDAAAAPGAGHTPAGAALLRSVALMGLVSALADRLRSVFVPYYRGLLDLCVEQLTGGLVATPSKKKRKKGAATDASAAGPSSDPALLEAGWRLRLRVVRALHRCFRYDSVGFMDAPRVERLLPPLVAQLAARPPPEAVSALERDASAGDGGLEAGLVLGKQQGGGEAGVDVLGRAVVAALAQLAVTAGSDAQWKPINHAVLMATRSIDARTRLLGLEAAAQLADRLAEEYLVLLPETLPFLSELLEDPEHAVEARAAEVVRRLEELSGESLGQYLS